VLAAEFDQPFVLATTKFEAVFEAVGTAPAVTSTVESYRMPKPTNAPQRSTP
jgi:hypothetical protein